ncbi:MAG: hypothetical protein GX642_14345 [Smithella sp.]|nr:hypothetical protein [Smithella sp.]
MNTQTGKLLLDEPPLVVLPSLAEAIGLEAAVVLQQLHFLIRRKLERHKERPDEKERDIHDGRVWVYNSYCQWKENYFRFLSTRSIQRIFLGLEKQGLIIVGNYNESYLNKTKWYSLNYDHPLIHPPEGAKSKKSVRKLYAKFDKRKKLVDHANLAQSTGQDGVMDSANQAPSYTKSSSDNSSNTTTTALSSAESSEKSPDGSISNRNFQVPESADVADQIIQDVIQIIDPNDEKIRNKNNLKAAMKKKLMAGDLGIPENWEFHQTTKREKVDRESADVEIKAEYESFPKLIGEFEKLAEIEKQKYLEAAKKQDTSKAAIGCDGIGLKLAVSLWSKDRRNKINGLSAE